jgi:excisionase family DNA binding protein
METTMTHVVRESVAGSGDQAGLRRLALSVDEAAAALGLSASSIWKWISLGQLRAVRLGGRTVITAKELDRVLADGIQ